MKSGMLAADVVADAISASHANTDLATYATAYKSSWAYEELYRQRNFGPAQHRWGNFWGLSLRVCRYQYI